MLPDQVFATMKDHLGRNLTFHGQERGLVVFRKYAIHYLKPYLMDRQQRLALMSCTSPDDFLSMISQIITCSSGVLACPVSS